MRLWSFSLVLLALLALPKHASAQQAGAAAGKKSEDKSKTISSPAPIPENWGVLDDLKTGLEQTASVEVSRDEQPDYVRELVRVQWRIGDPIDLWVIRPKITGKVPVVLYLYNYSDSNDRFHDNGWCKRATADGFAAVGFVSALTDYRFKMRPLKTWFVSELQESLGSSVHDVQLILNYVANRGDMDMDHVGMFGLGSGATIAILAAHADPRIKTLDLLDPWGDWPNWLEQSPRVPDTERGKYLHPDFLKSVETLDPLAYLASLKNVNLRLQQTSSDPVTPKLVQDRMAAAVPDPSQVVKYASAADLLKAWSTTGLSGWIKQQLRSPNPKVSGEDHPVALNSNSQ